MINVKMKIERDNITLKYYWKKF